MRPSPISTDRLEVIAERLGVRASAGVLAVSDRDGAEFACALGHARVEDRFLLTSITKAFTAVQVLLLVECGDLHLDTPIAKHLPEFGTNGKDAITARHVLTHCSGIHQQANTVEGPATEMSGDDHLAVANAAPPSFPPGTRFEYSSPGYWVLGELVARLSGVSYPEHLRTFVAEPLGLASTGYELGANPPANLVPPTVSSADAHVPEQVRRTAYPAGGIIGSATDLLSFGRALLRGGAPVLTQSSIDEMLRPVLSGQHLQRAVTWGLGWEIGGPGSRPGNRTLFHAGASGVGMWIDFDAGLVVVLLTATWRLPWSIYAEVADEVLAGRTVLEGMKTTGGVTCS